MLSALHPIILTLAATQLGLVTRRQLIGAGLRPAVVDGLVRHGRLERVFRGVYRVPGTPVTVDQMDLAATLRAGEGAHIAGRSALRRHGVKGHDNQPRTVLRPGRVVTGMDLDFVVTDGPPLHADDASVVGGAPTTGPTRALIDAAPTLTAKELRTNFDHLNNNRRTSPSLLRRRAAAMGGHHGAQKVLAFVGSADSEQRSEGERLMKRVFAHTQLSIRWNPEILDGCIPDGVVDDVEVALFYDGDQHHRERSDRDHDAAQRLRLAASGWLVIVVTHAMLVESPAGTVAMVLRAVEQRRRERSA